MNRALQWLFETKRLTYGDLLALFVGLEVGGWKGMALLLLLFFAGAYIGGINKAWRDDKP